MAKICSICGKGSMMVQKRVKLRGKYNPTIKKRKYPNLQYTRLLNGKPASAKATAGRRVLACAKCIKAQSKRK